MIFSGITTLEEAKPGKLTHFPGKRYNMVLEVWMPARTHPARRKRKRPIAGTIIVLLTIGEILLRLYWVVDYGLLTRIWIRGFPLPFWEHNLPTVEGLAFATTAFRLLWLLVGMAVLIGLLRMKRWSWVMLVFWVSVSLAVGILHYFLRTLSPFNTSDFAVMAADMVLVFALNQGEIQRLYGIRREDVEQLS